MCCCQVSSMLFLFKNLLIICSVNCWPLPLNDGTCEVSIEYELDNEHATLYDDVVSIHPDAKGQSHLVLQILSRNITPNQTK